jgi:hypothetical protein
MGIGVGVRVIRNREFLKTIQSRHPGIYSQEEFLLRIKNGATFFSTKGSGDYYYPDKPRVLISTEKYSGTIESLKASYTYVTETDNNQDKGFISYFFHGGGAIFLSENDMKKYQEDMIIHSGSLRWEAI